MRRIHSFIAVSLDGFYAGEDGDLDWHNVDDQFEAFAAEQLAAAGAVIYGRKTYEGMADYWPTNDARRDDPEVARLMNDTDKIVFSKTLTRADWGPARLVSTDLAHAVENLKAEDGPDLLILGSPSLTASFVRHRLLDELRLMVMPVLLGLGQSLFEGLGERTSLELVNVRTFRNGNVLLTHHPV